jgi:lactate racemase
MAKTQEFMVSCGTGKILDSLPTERTRIAPSPPASATLLADAAASFRQALAEPIGMPPLQKLVRKEAKVAIGIRDGQATYYERDDQDLRILGLPILMELLQQHGVRPEDHSDQNRRRIAPHVDAQGDDPHPGVQVALNPGWRLSYMDATDTSQFVNLRMTGRGMEVMVHCSVVESDLFIFMSTPQGFFQGGWKSILAGMGNWESIRYHPPGPSLRGIPCRTRRTARFISC